MTNQISQDKFKGSDWKDEYGEEVFDMLGNEEYEPYPSYNYYEYKPLDF